MDRVSDTAAAHDAQLPAQDGRAAGDSVSADSLLSDASPADWIFADPALLIADLVPVPASPGDDAAAAIDGDDAGDAALLPFFDPTYRATVHWGHDAVAGKFGAGGLSAESTALRAQEIGLLGDAETRTHADADESSPFALRFAAASGGNAAASVAAPGGPLPDLVPTDPMFAQQWHLATINIQSVWNDYTGAGIVVGLIDDGVEYTHPDLAANYNTALDWDSRNNDADAFTSSTSDQHGTSVAGVIAAVEGNGTGVVGVAFGAEIAGFRIGFGSNGGISQITNAFQHAINVDVVNNSWGYSGFFSDNFANAGFAAAGAAVQNDAANGRGGLGTVIVFAAGNGRTSGDSVDYHGFQDSPYVISVAATDSSNHVASFSSPGAGVLLSAPGVNITTTDRVGSLGFSSGDYTTVSGTSFSSPIVSGVVALMLEANPNLGYRDVQEILAYSSDQIDKTNSRWSFNGADNWNGGGLHFSPDYGFGLVDAHAAVRLAETWTTQHTFANMISANASRASAQAIPANNATGISQSVSLGSNVLIDHVSVDLNITHTWIGDLRVILIAPDGTQSVLVDRPGINPDTNSGSGSSQDNINFTVTSNQFWGEQSAGQWTLQVEDVGNGGTGTLNSWALHVYGDAVTSDDTYVYTDEYGTFTGAANAARRLLTDGNGGTDTLNASAVSTSSFIDLTAGHNSTIAGNTLTIAAGTSIENVFGGDGNDTLLGNALDNELSGGRGNDSIIGGDGNDTITGGAGNDILDGGNGTDVAIYKGAFAEYTIVVVDPTHMTITDNLASSTNEGTDSLANFEDLQFSDTLYALISGPPNTPPVANTDTATTNEDNAVTISVLANDTDADGDTISLTGAANGAHGTVVNNGNGTVTYTPAANYNGADSFTYSISDGHGGTATGTVNVTVNPVNDPPVANTDSATTAANTAVIVNVLANDTDVDGDVLSVTGAANGAHGTVVNNGNGTVTYTPAANYSGADSFTYSISDGHGGTATGTVNITVNPPPNVPPVANTDTVTTPEDTGIVVSVLANDTDANGDTLTLTGVGAAAHGTVANNGNGTVTYTPSANYNGADSFTYSISDGHGGTATGTVNVTVSPVNDPPVANPDSATTVQNTPVIVNVRANDTDVDGDTITVTGAANGAHGTVVNNGDGTVTYTPASNYTGADSFTYTISDGHGGTASGTVGITVTPPVNVAPVANTDTVTTPEDTAAVVAVLANDTDANNDTLTITGVGAAAHGAVVNNGNGTVTYTPSANYNGADSFTYSISDGHGGTATGTVNVTVSPVNDAPVANADTATTAQDTPITVNVLGNDTDVDGDALSVTNATNPAHGAAVVNANGTITYTPAAGYTGADSFNYTISDGHGGSAQASVSLTVLAATPVTLISSNFDGNSGGFSYLDDAFGTSQPAFESGAWGSTGGSPGGALQITLGGVSKLNATGQAGMSAGWEDHFNLSTPTDVTLTFEYKITQTPNYSAKDFGQALVSVDGVLIGTGGHDYVDQINGNGSGGISLTTGWKTVTIDLGVLSAGSHTLTIGGFSSQANTNSEATTVAFDNLSLATNPGGLAASAGASAPSGAAADSSGGSHLIGALANDDAPGTSHDAAGAPVAGTGAVTNDLRPDDVLDFHGDGIDAAGAHGHAAAAPPTFAAAAHFIVPDFLASLNEHAQAVAHAAHGG